MLRAQGHPLQAHRPVAGDLQGRPARPRLPRNTVPAMKIDGRKVQGSRQIARELERLQPEPPLFPADPEQRAAVEEAERFGDEELQHPIRQILWWTIKRDKAPLRSYSEGAKLGVPIGLAVKTAAPIVAARRPLQRGQRRERQARPGGAAGLLQKVDDWIAAGVLGGEQLNAADFQIAPSIGLAMTLDDLRPAIEGRPAGELAKRVVPDYPGHTPPILPAAWLRRSRDADRSPPEPSGPGQPSHSFARGPAAPRARRRGSSRRAAPGRGRAPAAAPARSGGWSPRGAAGSGARSPARCRRAGAGRRRAAGGCAAGRRARGRGRPRSPCRRRAAPPARGRCGCGSRR